MFLLVALLVFLGDPCLILNHEIITRACDVRHILPMALMGSYPHTHRHRRH